MDELTIPAAADLLGISASGLYAAIERKEVKSVERLGRMGVTTREVERFKLILNGRNRRGPKANGAKGGRPKTTAKKK